MSEQSTLSSSRIVPKALSLSTPYMISLNSPSSRNQRASFTTSPGILCR